MEDTFTALRISDRRRDMLLSWKSARARDRRQVGLLRQPLIPLLYLPLANGKRARVRLLPRGIKPNRSLRRLQAAEVKLRSRRQTSPGLQVRTQVEVGQVGAVGAVRFSQSPCITQRLRRRPTSRRVPNAHPW
eukprot:898928-Amphidinium_carterae.1